ncbi:MAG: DUF1232 domain-containing protein [Polyangiales bacterium]
MSESPEKPAAVKVDAKPAEVSAGAKAVHRRATLLSVLTSPRAWARFFRDKSAPTFPKVVAVLALVYVVSPIDALPDFTIPIVSWLDDLGVATIAATWLASVAAKYQNAEQLPAEAPPADKA